MSLSSISNECDRECLNGSSWKDFEKAQFYTFEHQPLVYYAQIPECSIKACKCRDTKKDSPNCFVKAFRWYTQEHVNYQKNHSSSGNIGFASWLDQKYDQFLHEKQPSQPYTSTTFQEKKTPQAVQEPRNKNKFSRIKSPWRKRRKHANSKNGGDMCKKCNNSWEILLHPKEMTRPASDTHLGPTTSRCIPSNGTEASSDTQIIQKKFQVCRSSTCFLSETEIHVSYTQKCADNCNTDRTKTKEVVKADNAQTITSFVNDEVHSNKMQLLAVDCQCSKNYFDNIDRSTQFESNKLNAGVQSTQSDSPGNNAQRPQSFLKPSVQMIKTISTKKSKGTDKECTECRCPVICPNQYYLQQVDVAVQTVFSTCCPCELGTKGKRLSSMCTYPGRASTKNDSLQTITTEVLPTTPGTCLRMHGIAQTSDNSINLGQAVNRGQPLFLKIIIP